MNQREKIKTVLGKLNTISSSLDYLYAVELQELQDSLDENKYKVAVIGEFSSGKSTFLNALLGKRILYSSNNEATGIVTFLSDGDTPKAFVYDEDNCIDEIVIDKSGGQEKLKKYVNIKTTDNLASKVFIQYPLKNIDKEIVLIDTPGLQGVSEKQSEITKLALKQANATIVLITPKGLTETELKLLSGKDEKFGKINTKDVFIVINKIGEVYENVSSDAVDKKIEEIKQSVIEKLTESGVYNIKLFAVDSRDYLWSQDDDLYKEVVEKNDSSIKTILSQEEYLHRSEFDNFKTFLYSFLESSQRNKNFLEDIEEKIYLIINAYKEKLQEKAFKSKINNDKILEHIYKEKEDLISNRRRLYNNLVRQSENSLSDYLESMNKDLEDLKKKRQKEILHMIENNIKDKNDLNKSKLNECFNLTKKLIKEDKNILEKELNDYTVTITNIMITKRFEQEFIKIFKTKPDFNISIEYNDFKVNMKNEKNNEFYIQDKDIKEKENEIKELELEIKRIKDNIYILINVKKVNSRKKEIKNEILETEENYRIKIKNLGQRPEPKTKYKTKIVKKKIFLLFTKEKEQTVPDGLDYTERDAWDRKKSSIYDQYCKDLNELYKEDDDCKKQIRNLNRYKDKLLEYENIIRRKNEEIEDLHKIRERIKQNHEKEFLADKKSEISMQVISYANESYKYIKENIEDYIYDLNKNIKKSSKYHIEKYIEKYSKELDEKIKKAEKKLTLSDNKAKEITQELDNIWGKM